MALLQFSSRCFLPRRFSVVLVAIMWGLLPNMSQAKAQDFAELSRLDKLKAAYIFNFTKFISWPELDDNSPRQAVVVCLSKHDPLMGFLRELVGNRKVGEQHLRVEITHISVNSRCDLAYLSDTKQPVFEGLHQVPIISADRSIFQNVATFSFYEEGKRLRFEIDMQRLKALELEISSELLKLARIKKT